MSKRHFRFDSAALLVLFGGVTWTIGIVTVGDASATVDNLTTYHLGTPGVDGAANMGRGYDGQRKTLVHLTQN